MRIADPTVTGTTPLDGLSARHGGAKALLLTVLGEFVLPAGGSVWTSTLVEAADLLGVGEKNARQAVARIGEHGLIEPDRHGRRVRWWLTEDGRRLLQEGARRIYAFGAAPVAWTGEWLVAVCPGADSGRTERNRLRTRLGFLGFGEISPTMLISPHVDREPELRGVLADLGFADDSIVLRSTARGAGDHALVARAWDLEHLAAAYGAFDVAHRDLQPGDAASSFRATVQLVHEWRRFPLIDPELPTELLPERWAGETAARLFHERRDRWSPAAREWFERRDAPADRS